MKNNLMKKLVGTITNNFGLKLLAVIVSCGLWFVVNNINDPMEKRQFNNIIVDLVNADLITNEGKVYEVVDGTNYVNVTVIGKSSVLKNITREDIKAVADIAELTFMNTVGIDVSSSRNNSELEFRTNIDNVRLSIENMKNIQKNINVLTSGKPAEGYVVGNISGTQNVVRLSGPESLINLIDHVEAVTSIDGYASDINTSVELKLYDVDGNEIKNSSIKMNISTVNVTVTILATKEVPLSFTATDEPEDGYVANDNIICSPRTVLIAGRKSVLDAISKISITDPALSLTDRTENLTVDINVKKYLPSGTQFADSSFNGNVTVTIAIEPIVTRELNVPARNFAVGNKPEGFAVTLLELENSSNFTIRISGTQDAVDAIDAEAVIGVVDMNALMESLGLDTWVAGDYVGKITFNLPDSVELEEPYQLSLSLKDPNEIDNNNDEIGENEIGDTNEADNGAENGNSNGNGNDTEDKALP